MSEPFSTLLQRYRERAGLDKKALAEKAGVDRGSIASWEAGEVAPRSRAVLQDLTGLLEISEAEATALFLAWRQFRARLPDAEQEPEVMVVGRGASCFVCYSTTDEPFVQRLVARLRSAGVEVWYAPEDLRGGALQHEQFQQAIQAHDRLLLVLSEASISSTWVESELRWAVRAESPIGTHKLFPIRLVDLPTLQHWSCFDADTGRDLAVVVRSYFLPDFSHWQDAAIFEGACVRLLRDLGAS